MLLAHKTSVCWYLHMMIAEQLQKRLNAERQDPASELSRIIAIRKVERCTKNVEKERNL